MSSDKKDQGQAPPFEMLEDNNDQELARKKGTNTPAFKSIIQDVEREDEEVKEAIAEASDERSNIQRKKSDIKENDKDDSDYSGSSSGADKYYSSSESED